MTDINFVRVGAAMSFVRRSVASSGLLTVALETPSGAMVEADDGVSITGVRITDSGSDATSHPLYHEAVLLLRGKPGATATIVHEDTGELAAHRIRCSTGAGMTLLPDQLIALVYRFAESRWVAHDLRGEAGPAGADGEDGATGPAGPQGPAGPNNVTSYSGTTSGAGTFTHTFAVPFTNAPHVTASLVGGTSRQYERVTSRSNTGFTVTTYTDNVVNVLGVDVVAGSPVVTNGLTVDVVVVSND